jgi:hypothetical protein
MQGSPGTRSLRHAEHFAELAKLEEIDQGIGPHHIFNPGFTRRATACPLTPGSVTYPAGDPALYDSLGY